MIINPPTKRISVTAEQQTFLRVLPTRWRRKPAGIDMEQNNVIVILCIRYAQWPAKAESEANTRCDPPGSSTERYRTFNNRLLSSSGEKIAFQLLPFNDSWRYFFSISLTISCYLLWWTFLAIMDDVRLINWPSRALREWVLSLRRGDDAPRSHALLPTGIF